MAQAQSYGRRNYSIKAMQHDGTDESAIDISNWIMENGGKCEVFLSNSHEFEKDSAYIRLESGRSANLLIPGSWAVLIEDGSFYAVLDADFQILYQRTSDE